MKILFVLTSHSQLGFTDKKTGFWIDEFATPYYVLFDAGATITIASPAGGQPPVDPKSEELDAQSPATHRFFKDSEAIDKVDISIKLSEVNAADFDAVFYPGGHGPMWDLAIDKNSIKLIADFYKAKKPMAFVCHGPAALVNVKLESGQLLIEDKNITGFSDTEEEQVGLTNVVPFLLEQELKKYGAIYNKGKNWSSFTQQDGLLITGQNPASSEAVAELLLKALKNEK
jgi:putative intracellular protease/amidase